MQYLTPYSWGDRLDLLKGDLGGRPSFFLIDSKLKLYYPFLIDMLQECFPEASCVEIEVSEEFKQIEQVMQLISRLIDQRATRETLLINIGGGCLSDLGGFAASIYKRGIEYINIPTTLLAMIDAAIGGKTAVNVLGYKNLVGSFHMPREVYLWPELLGSLPIEELRSGYGELIKYAVLIGGDFLDRILNSSLWQIDLEQIEQAVAYKNEIVAIDPLDSHLRQVLNLGHTWAHALEATALQRGLRLLHGEAVAWGVLLDGLLLEVLSGERLYWVEPLGQLLAQNYAPLFIKRADFPELLDAMWQDKKNTERGIRFMLPQAGGGAIAYDIVREQPLEEALELFYDLLQRL